MDRQVSNFLLKGGRLLDPAAGRDGLFDVRVRDGVIDAIGTNLPVDGITVIDVEDLLVTPGLIDVHLHLMKGLGAFGADPDIFGVGSGVTTVVDAGSAGHTLLNVFRNYVTKNAKTRVLNYINLSTLGGVTWPGNGKLWPQVRDAKESGVLMDVGHGLHNLNFDVARKVLDQGLHPDGVSTDGHRGNRAGPVYDLPTTMAKLMALGFTLNEVVEMATVNAARLLGRLNQLGSLRIGEPAASSVLRAEAREWKAVDSQKGTIPAHQAIAPAYAVRGDTVYEPLAIERP